MLTYLTLDSNLLPVESVSELSGFVRLSGVEAFLEWKSHFDSAQCDRNTSFERHSVCGQE